MSSAHESEEEDAAAEENEGEGSGDVADDDNNNSAAEEGDEEQYVVEKIVEEMLAEDGNVWYLIRWEGYEPDKDTWEPYENIKQCTDIIASWEASKAARAKQKGIKVSRYMLIQLWTGNVRGLRQVETSLEVGAVETRNDSGPSRQVRLRNDGNNLRMATTIPTLLEGRPTRS
jgi:Chromo (CHRromatin Organisation MOdifier) domain